MLMLATCALLAAQPINPGPPNHGPADWQATIQMNLETPGLASKHGTKVSIEQLMAEGRATGQALIA